MRRNGRLRRQDVAQGEGFRQRSGWTGRRRGEGAFGAFGAFGGCPALELAGLDPDHEVLGLIRRLAVVFLVQEVPQRLVDPERAGRVAVCRMVLHQDAAGALVGRIDLGRRLPSRRVERALQAAREPLVQRLTLHEEPQPERRVEFLEPAQERLGKALAVEKERVHVPGLRRALFDRPHVDAEQRRAQADVVATDDEAGKADRFEQLAKLVQGLAERAAGLFLARLAPQQPAKPLARFAPPGRQQEVRDDGLSLLVLDRERLAVMRGRECIEQRDRERGPFCDDRFAAWPQGRCCLLHKTHRPQPKLQSSLPANLREFDPVRIGVASQAGRRSRDGLSTQAVTPPGAP
jgi:hypothetical protein